MARKAAHNPADPQQISTTSGAIVSAPSATARRSANGTGSYELCGLTSIGRGEARRASPPAFMHSFWTRVPSHCGAPPCVVTYACDWPQVVSAHT